MNTKIEAKYDAIFYYLYTSIILVSCFIFYEILFRINRLISLWCSLSLFFHRFHYVSHCSCDERQVLILLILLLLLWSTYNNSNIRKYSAMIPSYNVNILYDTKLTPLLEIRSCTDAELHYYTLNGFIPFSLSHTFSFAFFPLFLLLIVVSTYVHPFGTIIFSLQLT